MLTLVVLGALLIGLAWGTGSAVIWRARGGQALDGFMLGFLLNMLGLAIVCLKTPATARRVTLERAAIPYSAVSVNRLPGHWDGLCWAAVAGSIALIALLLVTTPHP